MTRSREPVEIPPADPLVPAADDVSLKNQPVSATPISGACSNLPIRPMSPTRSGIEDLPVSLVRDEVGAQSKRKKISFVRKFPAKSRNSSGSKQSMTGVCRRLDKDLGSMSCSGPVPASPVAPSPAIRSPTSTARKGRRVADAGGSIMERAERRAAAKDLPPSGNHLGASQSSSLIRLVLPSLSYDLLLNIMSDVGVLVDPEVGSPVSLLSTIRANKLAQAAIAKAKEVVASSAAASVVTRAQGEGVEVGSGQPQPSVSRRGPAKRSKPCAAPSRSSLRIKNMSYK